MSIFTYISKLSTDKAFLLINELSNYLNMLKW